MCARRCSRHIKLRDMALNNRVVVSPMAQYKARDGAPTDWHLVHYGERAKGGAGLVYTEMTCVSADGRITPGVRDFMRRAHEVAVEAACRFCARETEAKICCQIGHSGRKGSTQLGWEEMDAPLAAGNWPILSASALAWSPRNAVPEGDGPRRYGRVCAMLSLQRHKWLTARGST